ncbi:hypothetical protein, partial [Agreia sp.]|uniref:hypothetical protein n=1 Tax=Agreia sp. TaxID=1872416 RepID=UPI0035BBC458
MAVIGDAAKATSTIDQFVRDLDNIPGRRDVVISEVIQQTGAPRRQVGGAYNASGAVLKFFANGGTKNHVARIAR